jgi:hypothetical protein
MPPTEAGKDLPTWSCPLHLSLSGRSPFPFRHKQEEQRPSHPLPVPPACLAATPGPQPPAGSLFWESRTQTPLHFGKDRKGVPRPPAAGPAYWPSLGTVPRLQGTLSCSQGCCPTLTPTSQGTPRASRAMKKGSKAARRALRTTRCHRRPIHHTR